MPVATAGGSSQLEDLEPGTHQLTCIEINEVTLEKPDAFGKTEKYAFKFRIDGMFDEEGEPLTIGKRLNRTFTPKSTYWKWNEVLLGRAVREGENIPFGELVGKSCMGVITEAPRENGGTWKNIDSIFPIPKRGTAVPATGTTGENTSAFLQADASGNAIVDWATFWAIARRHGINKNHVLMRAHEIDARVTEDVAALDPWELPELLNGLIEKTKVPA